MRKKTSEPSAEASRKVEASHAAAGDQADAAAGRAQLPRPGLPLVDVVALFGVLGPARRRRSRRRRGCRRRRARAACRRGWRRALCRWRPRPGIVGARPGVRRSGCRRRRSSVAAPPPAAGVEVDLASGRPLLVVAGQFGAGEEGEVGAVGADPGGAGGRRVVARRRRAAATLVGDAVAPEEEPGRGQVVDVGAVGGGAEDALDSAGGSEVGASVPVGGVIAVEVPGLGEEGDRPSAGGGLEASPPPPAAASTSLAWRAFAQVEVAVRSVQ